MKYLSPRDIAEEIGVSRSRAYEIARECTRIVVGRTIRVSRQAFDAWKKRHEESPACRVRFSKRRGAPSGGAASPTPKAAGTSASRRASATEQRPSPHGEDSVESPSRVPIVPRTAPRSLTR